MSAAKMATSLRDWLSGMVSPWFDESSVPSSVEKKTTTPVAVSLGEKEAGGETRMRIDCLLC
jgi:hypothetical protein